VDKVGAQRLALDSLNALLSFHTDAVLARQVLRGLVMRLRAPSRCSRCAARCTTRETFLHHVPSEGLRVLPVTSPPSLPRQTTARVSSGIAGT